MSLIVTRTLLGSLPKSEAHESWSRVHVIFRRSWKLVDCSCWSFQARSIAHTEGQPVQRTELMSSRSIPAREASSADCMEVDISYPAYMIWGANTNVGKTLVSAGLSSSILFSKRAKAVSVGSSTDNCTSVTDVRKDVLYIKPVQTGYPVDSDARFVTHQVANNLKRRHLQDENRRPVRICNQTLKASPKVFNVKDGVRMIDLDSYEELFLEGSQCQKIISNCHHNQEDEAVAADYSSLHSQLTCKTIWAWFDPVSPHLAAEMERTEVKDSSVLESVTNSLQSLVDSNFDTGHDNSTCDVKQAFKRWAIIETAGGVASPGPSGTLQCDIYRPLRLPGILVGDGRLGGISSTIAAFESLQVRGYEVDAIGILDSGLGNEVPLRKYLRGRVPVLVLPPVPADLTEDLGQWYGQCETVFSELQNILEDTHQSRIQRLQEMPGKAGEIIWWPFTQHSMVPIGDVTVIDSRCGDMFSVHKVGPEKPNDVIVQQFDGCASWWTQGPDLCMQQELARDVGYAAARYGHIMFPENVHEPALKCAEILLQAVGRGWAKRVYYSDNGSTAIEIALKMAFRKFINDHGLLDEFDHLCCQPKLKVLALRGSYHGDTLGAMEAQAPSSYTGFLQQPWYSGRGSFIDPPTVQMQQGHWILSCPESFGSYEAIQDLNFKSRDDIFDLERDQTSLSDLYKRLIQYHLSSHKLKEDNAIAALIIEPVIHGAGGMEMIDPLFQRILVKECRRCKIPVIFDEVFAGCWRLGVQSAIEILKCYPDIACYSKLLTGGTIPLSATLATEAVFEAFKGESKLDALLHGHSYSAHALGCTMAVTSLQYFSNPLLNANLMPNGRLQELWNPELVVKISCHPSVQRVVTLGTVFACELQCNAMESGYASVSSKQLIRRLRMNGVYARPLGNVVYLMCGPLTSPQTCCNLLKILHSQLKN